MAGSLAVESARAPTAPSGPQPTGLLLQPEVGGRGRGGLYAQAWGLQFMSASVKHPVDICTGADPQLLTAHSGLHQALLSVAIDDSNTLTLPWDAALTLCPQGALVFVHTALASFLKLDRV